MARDRYRTPWAHAGPNQRLSSIGPGKLHNELSIKVPTRLQYDQYTEQVKKSGLQCNHDEDSTDVKEFFKFNLDPNYDTPKPNAPKAKDARRWLRDYLRCVHNHVRETFSDAFPRWTAQRTEFVSSVPTTWNNPRMIADMEAVIRDAGFGSAGAEHRTRIGLTEAEAAAVYAFQQQLEENDIPSCVMPEMKQRFDTPFKVVPALAVNVNRARMYTYLK